MTHKHLLRQEPLLLKTLKPPPCQRLGVERHLLWVSLVVSYLGLGLIDFRMKKQTVCLFILNPFLADLECACCERRCKMQRAQQRPLGGGLSAARDCTSEISGGRSDYVDDICLGQTHKTSYFEAHIKEWQANAVAIFRRVYMKR